MAIRDARDLAEGALLETDLCIVGAGAAGLALAQELEGSPFDVTLLESGGLGRETDADELDEMERVGLPFRLDADVRHRALGGTTIAWAGRCATLDDSDFAESAGGRGGWPFGAPEIERFLPRVREFLGLEQTDGLASAFWSGEDAYEVLRGEEMEPKIHLFARSPDLGRRYRRALERSRTTTVYLHATVGRLVALADSAAVTQLEGWSAPGREFRIAARAWVLACGGLENPRLLLLSNDHRPAGLGNDRDLVGRYYMDHPRGDGIGRLFLDRTHPLYSKLVAALLPGHQRRVNGPMQLALALRPDLRADQRLSNAVSFCYGAATERLARLRPPLDRLMELGRSGRRSGTFRADVSALVAELPLLASAAWQNWRRRPFELDHLVLVDQVEQMPDPASRVLLSDRRDRFGQALVRLDWRIDPGVTRSLRALHRSIAEHVRRTGVGRLESRLLADPLFEPDYTECAHPMGTTRMDADRCRGVVDANSRVHGVSNLFVAGSSVFPSGGNAPPTLTVCALAIRLADHLRQTLTGAGPAVSSAPGVGSMAANVASAPGGGSMAANGPSAPGGGSMAANGPSAPGVGSMAANGPSAPGVGSMAANVPSAADGAGSGPDWSIVIPTRDRPAMISKCLESIARLDTPPGGFEVVVVDDGSNPPLEIAPQWYDCLDLRLLNQQNTGPGGARNLGMAQARGRWVAFTDDDCRPAADWLVALARRLEELPDALVGGRTLGAGPSTSFSEANQFIAELVYAAQNPEPQQARFFASNNLAGSRCQLLESGGFDAAGFDIGAAEDRDLCARWLERGGRMVYARDATIVHHHRSTALAFAEQHFRYGRGAARYHSLRRARGTGRMRDDVGVHLALGAYLAELMTRVPPSRAIGLLGAISLWQSLNALGFLFGRSSDVLRAQRKSEATRGERDTGLPAPSERPDR
jgi:choline dehydrogenase-like flavoprotein/GT2 family glycosyltransferase